MLLSPADFDPESHEIHHDYDTGSDDATSSDGVRDTLGGTELNGREHYEEVAPSVLRKVDGLKLDGRYAGSVVKRAKLSAEECGVWGDMQEIKKPDDGNGKNESDDDPFPDGDEGSDEDVWRRKSGSGSSESSQDGRSQTRDIADDALSQKENSRERRSSRLNRKRKRGSSTVEDAQNYSTASDQTDDMDDGTISEQQSGESMASLARAESGTSDTDIDMHDSISSKITSDALTAAQSVPRPEKKPAMDRDRAALRALVLSSDSAAVTSSISAAVAADAKKGQAIKRQQNVYDRLLDARIKLQRGLTAANTLTVPLAEEQVLNDNDNAVRDAEEAALNLWNTIISMRHGIIEHQASSANDEDSAKTKTKRMAPTPAKRTTPVAELVRVGDSISLPQLAHHRAVLDKWSSRVRSSNPSLVSAKIRPSQRIGINDSSINDSSVSQVIDAYLSTQKGRLVEQSLSYSLTPQNAANNDDNGNVNNDNAESRSVHRIIYNDTPFYHTLLRDLISSRTHSSSTSSNAMASTNLFSATNNLQSSLVDNQAKKHRPVDTKASKGRKIRYNVHEKLENFMAAEQNWASLYNYDGDDDDGDGALSTNRDARAAQERGASGADVNSIDVDDEDSEAVARAGNPWASEATRQEFFGSLLGGPSRTADGCRVLDGWGGGALH